MKHPAPGARGRARSSLDQGLFVEINGEDQWLTIRGRDRSNPVLLLLSGAGGALSPMAPLFAPWERDFTLVQWDQPGAGATWTRNGSPDPFTIDRLVQDGLAVAQFVLRRLGVDKLAVLGTSGGSILGLRMIKARPDLVSVYAGNGQVVDWARQEALSYAMILQRARAAGDLKAVVELEEIGPPPWRDVARVVVKAKYANALTPREQAALARLDPAVMAAVNAPPVGARYVPEGLAPPDMFTRATAAFEALKGEIEAFDARRLGLTFDVPLVFLQGDQDAHTVTSEVQAYAAEVRSPRTKFVPIEGAGHMSLFLRDALLSLLCEHVRPLAVARSGAEPVVRAKERP